MTEQTPTAVAADAPASTDADRFAHLRICANGQPDESWSDRCTCGQLRARHANADHKPIQVGPGRVCSGRNLAGPCRNTNCPCARFTPEVRRG
jgi:hypothetical protein